MNNKPLTNKSGEVRELTAEDFARAKPASDFPELQAVLNTRGKQKTPTKKATTIRLSPEVNAFFRATGKGWQTRIDEVLKAYVAKQKA